MSEKFGFISALDEALNQDFHYDYEMNWDKKNFAIEVSFLLEVENTQNVELVDADGEKNEDNILYEDTVLFYNPTKTEFDEKQYLAALPYDEMGLSREFIAFFVQFLQDTVDTGLSSLMDFLENDDEAFEIAWDANAFEEGDEKLVETEFLKYPRY